MPLQNRVDPTGEIRAEGWRGTLTGNRGHLSFDTDGRLGTPRWQHQSWISCRLEHPRGTYRGPMPERGWTPLFFLDEAVALAAGHRPCGYCRRPAYARFRAASGGVAAKDMDRALHRARVDSRRRQRRFTAPIDILPDWCFVDYAEETWLVHGGQLRQYSSAGYAACLRRPKGVEVSVLTPAPMVAALAAGYAPLLHESL